MNPATLALLLSLLDKYGPDFVNGIIAIYKKMGIDVSDVEALFAKVKPYSAYGIPDKVP